MRKYSDITARYLKEHKKRSVLTVIGIIVSIAMFTAIGTMYYSAINGRMDQIKAEGGDYEVKFIELTKEKVQSLKSNVEIKGGGVTTSLASIEFDTDNNSVNKKLLEISGYDKEAINNTFKVKLVEGRMPKNENEIIVENRLYKLLKDKKSNLSITGKLLKDGKATDDSKTYSIVGSYENTKSMKNNQYYSITYLEGLDNQGNYEYYANLKEKKDKIAIGKKVAKDTNSKVEFNNDLLYLYGQGELSERNDALIGMFAIIVIFIIVCTTVVIYNSFNISVAERIKHFGILRSTGATKKQIRRLVFKEAAVMSIISIPIGIITGFIGIYITFSLIGAVDGILGSKPRLNLQIIGLATALGLVTIFISVFIPAIRASRVSPIEAVRGAGVVKREKFKRRKAYLTKLIFKFEGQVAYKNIRRSPKKFWITILSLMVSVVMFIFFANFLDYTKSMISEIYTSAAFDSMFSKEGAEGYNDKFVEDIKGYEGVGEVYKMNSASVTLPVDNNKVNKDYFTNLGVKDKFNYYKDKALVTSFIMGYDEKAFNYAKDKLKKGKPSYEDFVNDGIIVLNRSKGIGKKKRIDYNELTNYKLGDKVKLPRINSQYIKENKVDNAKRIVDNDQYITFTVVGVVDDEPMLHEVMLNGVGFMVANDNYSKLTGVKDYNTLAIKFVNKSSSEELFDKFTIKAEGANGSYIDNYKEMESTRKLMFQISVLIYGFITLISIIGIVNIVNIITINLLVRKREFAIFKAIGMTKKQFKKLVLLEGMLHGILASVFGTVVAFLLVRSSQQPMNKVINIAYNQAVWPYIVGVLGVIGITFLAALIPLRRLNDMNIMESLRLEE
ncbi:ABC transporter permease [Clostridium manihotivorum]|uniref:ABC transporter permease n=1 Tax=Clostridium manihotivorum TaxID=2320868 RepID=A0A3R5VBH3_9CLOT|nr:FtsX-like permease family protein [Clostridium manihotivorum]QAA34576.1 ABC transporter permease [Clostridium manihotivorum]